MEWIIGLPVGAVVFVCGAWIGWMLGFREGLYKGKRSHEYEQLLAAQRSILTDNPLGSRVIVWSQAGDGG